VLGPSATLAWQRLARRAADAERFTLDTADLAKSLGLGESTGPQSTIARALLRLVMFDAARRQGSALAIRPGLPDVPARQPPRLSGSARRAHAVLAHATTAPADTAQAVPARIVAL
jgi:hypothetical protein